jgi:biotin operon repressor
MMFTKVAKPDLKGELRLILSQHRGHARAIPGRELARMLGYRDDRQIRLVIRELIRDGLPVASSGKGYFLPESLKEADEYADSLKGRLIEDAYRRRDFKRSVGKYFEKVAQGRLL